MSLLTFTEPDYDALDPGIRAVVRLLRSHGFNTTDSGDGKTKVGGPLDVGDEVLAVPHVFIVSTPETVFEEARRLANLLTFYVVVTGGMVQAVFDPVDGVAIITLMGVGDAELGLT